MPGVYFEKQPLTFCIQWWHSLYTMRKIGNTKSVPVILRIPIEWWVAFGKMADEGNPVRELMRDALKQYLRRLGKVA